MRKSIVIMHQDDGSCGLYIVLEDGQGRAEGVRRAYRTARLIAVAPDDDIVSQRLDGDIGDTVDKFCAN